MTFTKGGPVPVAATAGALPAAEEARLKSLYSVMQSIENRLGGGEGVEGLYGSIKKSGMDKVVECLRGKCGLGSSSVLLDVGAGLGRPLMHALLWPGIAGARGIEIDRIKCDKAHAFLRQALAELARRGVVEGGSLVPPQITCSPIEEISSLDPCTHAYSFWEGVPVEGKCAFGRLFAASRSLRSVAVVQRAIRCCPLEYMEELGFGELALVGSFSVSMSGSGRSFTAYVFNKAHLPAALPASVAVEASAAQSVETPALAGDARAAVAAAAALSVSIGAAAGEEEAEGQCVQSRLAEGRPEEAPGAGTGRGRRQRKPSAKHLQASHEAEADPAGLEAGLDISAPAAADADAPFATVGGRPRQPRSAREQRADRRAVAVWEVAATSVDEGAPPAHAAQHAQQGQQGGDVAGAEVAASQAAAVPVVSPRRPGRSASRPAANSAKPASSAAAAKLSSPQKAGVQKRASPAKSGGASSGAPPLPRRTSPRKQLALPADAAPAKGGLLDFLPVRAAAADRPLLQRVARVTKAGGADAVAGKAQPGSRQAARRGLQGSLAGH